MKDLVINGIHFNLHKYNKRGDKMIFLYALYAAVIATGGLFILVNPYLEGKTKNKKYLGMISFFTLFGVQDIYMSIYFGQFSNRVNFANFLSYYFLQWFILFLFFKKRSFIKFVMIFGVDFLMSALASLIYALLYGMFFQYDYSQIESFTNVPSVLGVTLGLIGQAGAVMFLIPLVRVLVQKQNLLIHILATLTALVGIFATQINNSSSMAIVFPVFTFIVVAGLGYQEWELRKTRKMSEFYKKLENDQELKKEELQKLKTDVVLQLKNKTIDNEYTNEMLRNIEEKLKGI